MKFPQVFKPTEERDSLDDILILLIKAVFVLIILEIILTAAGMI